MAGMLAAFGAEVNTRAPILKQIQTAPLFVASAFAIIILASGACCTHQTTQTFMLMEQLVLFSNCCAAEVRTATSQMCSVRRRARSAARTLYPCWQDGCALPAPVLCPDYALGNKVWQHGVADFVALSWHAVIPIIRGADLARKGAGPFTPRAEVWVSV